MTTMKQEMAAKKVVENHGNISRAMLEVGYKPKTAKNPKNLTQSKAWPDLMEKYLPDNEVLEEHQKGLHATKPIGALVMIKQDDGKDVVYKDNEGVIEVDDTPTRLKAVELAYKVKGKLGNNGMNINVNEAKILVMPSELITKYEISSKPVDSSK
jgi:hypothetical protein